jgi:hypothetical protein
MTQFNRRASLATNLQDRNTDKGVRVNIIIASTNVPVSLSQIDGKGDNKTETDPENIHYRLSVQREFTPKKEPIDVKSALVSPDDDPENNEYRFTYIGHGYSLLYGCYETFWFDAKYGDIIKVPDLVTLVDVENEADPVKQNEINAEVISFRVDTSSATRTTKLTQDKVLGVATIEGVNDISGITSHIIRVNNFRNRSKTVSMGIVVDDNTYLEGPYTEALEAYSLGSTDALFTNETTGISNVGLKRYVSDSWTMVSNRVKRLDDILIIK